MLTLILVSLFVLSISFFSEATLRKSIQKRVETLSGFVTSVEDDLPRQLFIFGYRTIFLMENKIAQEGNYLGYERFDNLSREAFFYGTIDGVNQEMLAGSTYSDLVFLLQERAAKISADVDISNPILSVSQTDPWNVRVGLTMDFIVRDRNNLVLWNKTLESVSFISVSNFTDPVYLKEASVARDIVRGAEDIFGSAESLRNQLEGGYYRNYSNAPSFIDRLEGNIGGTNPLPRYAGQGIESFVHLEKDLGGGSLPQRSVVDYMYFNGGMHNSCAVVGGGLPSWFRLDYPEHINLYGVACS